MTDNTRRMVDDAMREARCPTNDDLLHRDKAVSVAVALVEKERVLARRDERTDISRALADRHNVAEKALAEARERWGHFNGCECHPKPHSSPRVPCFQVEKDNDGLHDHPYRDPRCCQVALIQQFDSGDPADCYHDAEGQHVCAPSAACANCGEVGKHDEDCGLAPPAAEPTRCGTCGSDDPVVNCGGSERNDGVGFSYSTCPDAFHSQPPAGKETRDGE